MSGTIVQSSIMQSSSSNALKVSDNIQPQWKEGVLGKREKGIIKMSWKDKFVILLDGSLFYYQTHTDLTPKGVYHLLNCQVLDAPEKKIKKKFAFCLHTPQEGDIYFSAVSEAQKQDWMDAIQKGLMKSPSPPPDKDFSKKTKSTSVYMSGRLIDSITNMGASGKILRDFLSEDTETILQALKTFFTEYYGSEKANRLEKQSISLATKISLLYKEKQVSKEYFQSTQVPLRVLISKIIDGFEIPFAFNVHEAIDALRAVQKALEQVIRPFLHEKSMAKMTGIFDVLCDEDMLADFFKKRKYKECEILGVTLRKL